MDEILVHIEKNQPLNFILIRDFDNLYAKKGGGVTSKEAEACPDGFGNPVCIKNWPVLLYLLVKNMKLLT